MFRYTEVTVTSDKPLTKEEQKQRLDEAEKQFVRMKDGFAVIAEGFNSIAKGMSKLFDW